MNQSQRPEAGQTEEGGVISLWGKGLGVAVGVWEGGLRHLGGPVEEGLSGMRRDICQAAGGTWQGLCSSVAQLGSGELFTGHRGGLCLEQQQLELNRSWDQAGQRAVRLCLDGEGEEVTAGDRWGWRLFAGSPSGFVAWGCQAQGRVCDLILLLDSKAHLSASTKRPPAPSRNSLPYKIILPLLHAETEPHRGQRTCAKGSPTTEALRGRQRQKVPTFIEHPSSHLSSQ